MHLGISIQKEVCVRGELKNRISIVLRNNKFVLAFSYFKLKI